MSVLQLEQVATRMRGSSSAKPSITVNRYNQFRFNRAASDLLNLEKMLNVSIFQEANKSTKDEFYMSVTNEPTVVSARAITKQINTYVFTSKTFSTKLMHGRRNNSSVFNITKVEVDGKTLWKAKLKK